MALDFAKCNRTAQRPDRGKVDGRPISFPGSGIWICRTNYFRDSHHRFVRAAMIKKNFIALLHPAKVVSRSVIAHASPTCLPFLNEVRPRVGGWFLFHKPEIFHGRR